MYPFFLFQSFFSILWRKKNIQNFLILLLFIIFSNNSFGYNFSDSSETNDKYIIVDSVTISGNKRTKAHIILRETLFKTGDTIQLSNYSEIIQTSINNLNNTSLFNFVFIDTNGIHLNKTFEIKVIERWYFWPFPYLDLSEHNFNTWWKTKDLKKINYGLYFVKENFRGRREKLSLFFRRGFEETYSVSYDVPYFNKAQTFGMAFSFGYARNKEVAFQVNNNKIDYFRVNDFYIRENLQATIQLNYRKNYQQNHALWVSYNSQTFADTLIRQNDFFSKNGMKNNQYFTVNYFYKNDKRDVEAYPLNGNYFDLDINKYGLGILKNEAANVFFIRMTFRKYLNLYKRFYYAFGNKIKFSNYDYQPFFLKKGLGYNNDYVRGYDYYVIDGISYWVFKNNLKFQLIQPRVFKINFIKSEKFNMIHFASYLNLFFDCGYAQDYKKTYNPLNNLSNSFLYGYGAGFDLVTYYDKVLRIEYAINKLGEHGFFINFVAPI
ncbi:MAG: POTRA domain-containing protein [Bacteroidales bacterium]|nr:POTRA domain-containing protein [Bacteroidales bacterium]